MSSQGWWHFIFISPQKDYIYIFFLYRVQRLSITLLVAVVPSDHSMNQSLCMSQCLLRAELFGVGFSKRAGGIQHLLALYFPYKEQRQMTKAVAQVCPARLLHG